jgi:hypothetical protein
MAKNSMLKSEITTWGHKLKGRPRVAMAASHYLLNFN